MEPNTSTSPAVGTSIVAVLEHGEPSVRNPSLLSPAFSPAPFPGFVPASRSGSGSGSGLSWYEQIPPSPAVAVGNGSLSVHAHATSSLQSLPSSSFPTANTTLPMVGYDLFSNPEVTADTPLPTLLGGQWEWEPGLSSMAASVLPECPSPGMFGFADESVAWLGEEMSSSFFSPSSAGGLAPQSSNNFVGFVQQSSDYEMEPLPPIEEEEEEEIDVSAFLVSDPEDQLPSASSMVTGTQMGGGDGGGASASWMATSPQMCGGGGGSGASASRIVPGSTGNNGPPMLVPVAVSTCTMVSTSSGSMACQSGGSSIGVASSIGGMMMPSSSPVLLVVPQGAGTSRTNFSGFAQPSSSSVLAPHAPNLQGPLLPVKQEVMECVDAIARSFPDFISLVDDEEDGLHEDVILSSIPGLNGGARSSSGHSKGKGPSFTTEAESRHNVFGSWGNSSISSTASFVSSSELGSSSGSRSFAPGSWGGSSGSPSFAAGSWGGGSSSSCSFAPSSLGGGSSSSCSFAPRSWGSSSSSPSFAPSSCGGGSSSPSFAPGSWGSSSSSSPNFAGSMPCFDRSTPIDNYGSSSMTKLPIGRGKIPSTSGLPPLPKACFRTRKDGSGIVFTDKEMAIIVKDKKLQEQVEKDPKRVKRILYNREYSQVSKVRKVLRTQNLEEEIVTLEEERKSLYAKLKSLEEGSAALMAEKKKMEILIGELEQQTMLKDVVREGLKAKIQTLKHQKLTNKPSTSRGEPMHG